MMYYNTVPADKYRKVSREYRKMGMPMTAKPVDMNYGYVPMNVSKASKNSNTDLRMAAECNSKRFL